MKMLKLLAVAGLVVIASPTFAEEGHMSEHSGMHMGSSNGMSMEGEQDCDQMPAMKQGKMKKMKDMMKMKQQHMQAMEERMANIESLLQQLVDLQKQKGTSH